MTLGKLMKIPEVMDTLKVSSAQLYRLMRAGKIKSIHIGRSRRIYDKDLKRYMMSLGLSDEEK